MITKRKTTKATTDIQPTAAHGAGGSIFAPSAATAATHLVPSSLGNWTTDCACLYLSARALNAHLTFTSVVVAYAIGQAILALPLTPGGIGIYEAGVTAALTRVGIRRGKALTSVMMYRFISFWGTLLVGWSCWMVLRIIDGRADRRLAAAETTFASESAPG